MIKVHHKNYDGVCPTCEARFPSLRELTNHLLSHNSNLFYHCPFTNESPTGYERLQKHVIETEGYFRIGADIELE